jgi:hypothetical protein
MTEPEEEEEPPCRRRRAILLAVGATMLLAGIGGGFWEAIIRARELRSPVILLVFGPATIPAYLSNARHLLNLETSYRFCTLLIVAQWNIFLWWSLDRWRQGKRSFWPLFALGYLAAGFAATQMIR